MQDHIKANSIFQFPWSLEMKLSGRCKEYCKVKKESFGHVGRTIRYPSKTHSGHSKYK